MSLSLIDPKFENLVNHPNSRWWRVTGRQAGDRLQRLSSHQQLAFIHSLGGDFESRQIEYTRQQLRNGILKFKIYRNLPKIPSTLSTLKDNLIAYWRFLNNGKDETLNGHTLELNDDVNGFFSDTGGILNGRLNTSNSGIGIEGSNASGKYSSLKPNGDYTLSFWVKFDELSGSDSSDNQFLFDWREDEHYGLYWEAPANKLTIIINGNYYRTEFTPQINIWYHIVVTRQIDTNIKLYINNQDEFTIDTILDVNRPVTDLFRIGGRDNSQATGGSISEAGIWHRVLTASEIQSLYNEGQALHYWNINANDTRVVFRYRDALNFYALNLRSKETILEKCQNGTFTNLANLTDSRLEGEQWLDFKVETFWNFIRVSYWLDQSKFDIKSLTATDGSFPVGKTGLLIRPYTETYLGRYISNYWQFRDSTDSIGSNNLTLSTGATLESNGTIGSGFYLQNSGNNGATNNGAWESIIGTREFSLSFWFLTTDSSAGHSTLCGWFAGGNNGRFRIQISSSKLRINIYESNDDRYYTMSNEIIENNKWYHVVCQRFNDNTVKLYLNGQLTHNAVLASVNIRIRFNMLMNSPQSKIAEAGIWVNRILNSNDVLDLYNSGKGFSHPFFTGTGHAFSLAEWQILNNGDSKRLTTVEPDLLFNYDLTGTTYADLPDSLRTNGARLYYTFDNVSGSTINSETGSYHGTMQETTAIVDGKVDSGVAFNADADVVTMGQALNFLSSPFSISFWVNRSIGGAVCTSHHNSTTGTRFHIFVSGIGEIIFFARNTSGSNTNVRSTTAMEINKWYHVVVTRESTTCKIYINGLLDKTGTTVSGEITTSNDTSSLSRTAETSNIIIDEFGAWTRELSAGEVTTLYNLNAIRVNKHTDSNLILETADSLVSSTGGPSSGTGYLEIPSGSPINIPNLPAIGTVDFSLTEWLGGSEPVDSVVLAHIGDSATYIHLSYDPALGSGGQFRLEISQNGSIVQTGTLDLNWTDFQNFNGTTDWAHLALTRWKNRVELYLNGHLEINLNLTLILNFQQGFTIGSQSQTGSFRVAEPTFWNRRLQSAEISYLSTNATQYAGLLDAGRSFEIQSLDSTLNQELRKSGRPTNFSEQTNLLQLLLFNFDLTGHNFHQYPEQLKRDLRAFYTFNNVDNSTVNDEMENFNGTLNGATIVSNGKINNGVTFNDNTDIVNLGNALKFPAGEDFSISCWFRRLSSGSNDIICTSTQSSDGGISRFFISIMSDTDRVRFLSVGDSSGTNLYSQSKIQQDKWYHLAVVRLDDIGYIYLNGQLDNSGAVRTGDITSHEGDSSLSRNDSTSNLIISEFGAWTRTLSPTEVQSIYELTALRADKNNSGICELDTGSALIRTTGGFQSGRGYCLIEDGNPLTLRQFDLATAIGSKSDWTMAFWVGSTEPLTNAVLIHLGDATNFIRLSYIQSTTTFIVESETGQLASVELSWTNLISGSQIQDWAHILLRRSKSQSQNQGRIELYLNGQLETSATLIVHSLGNGFTIGGQSSTGTFQLAEPTLWARDLNSSEINYLSSNLTATSYTGLVDTGNTSNPLESTSKLTLTGLYRNIIGYWDFQDSMETLTRNRALDLVSGFGNQVTPDNTASATAGGTNLGQLWFGGSAEQSGSLLVEAHLKIPATFREQSRYIIAEFGGANYGSLCCIFDRQLIFTVAFRTEDTRLEIRVDLDSIPEFYNRWGFLALGYERVKVNTWRIHLYWNGQRLAESPIKDMGSQLIGGNSNDGYLENFSDIVFTYDDYSSARATYADEPVFEVFPQAEIQGDLKLFKGRFEPFNIRADNSLDKIPAENQATNNQNMIPNLDPRYQTLSYGGPLNSMAQLNWDSILFKGKDWQTDISSESFSVSLFFNGVKPTLDCPIWALGDWTNLDSYIAIVYNSTADRLEVQIRDGNGMNLLGLLGGITVDLLSYWTLYGDTRDVSGNVGDLMLRSGALLNATGGIIKGEIDLNNGWLEETGTDWSNLIGSNGFTFSAWVYKISNSQGYLFAFNNSAETERYGLMLNHDGNGFDVLDKSYIVGLSENIVITHNNFLLNQWVHVVFTRSGNNAKLYFDGSLVYNEDNINANNGVIYSNLTIGSRNSGIFGLDDSRLSEISIWNRELTSNEILDLYNYAVNFSNFHTLVIGDWYTIQDTHSSWGHLALVRRTSSSSLTAQLEIYANGRLVEVESSNLYYMTPANNMQIGKVDTDLKLKIANLAVWSRALETREINRLWNQSWSLDLVSIPNQSSKSESESKLNPNHIRLDYQPTVSGLQLTNPMSSNWQAVTFDDDFENLGSLEFWKPFQSAPSGQFQKSDTIFKITERQRFNYHKVQAEQNAAFKRGGQSNEGYRVKLPSQFNRNFRFYCWFRPEVNGQTDERIYPPIGLTQNSEFFLESQVNYGAGAYLANESTAQANPDNNTRKAYLAFDYLKPTGGGSSLESAGWHSLHPSYSGGTTGNWTYNGPHSIGGISGEWISLELPQRITLKKYILYARDEYEHRAPHKFTILGSNDSKSWSVVDTQTDVSWPTNDGTVASHTFNIPDNKQSYRIHAIVVQEVGNDGGSVQILEWELFENHLVEEPDKTQSAEEGGVSLDTYWITDGSNVPPGSNYLEATLTIPESFRASDKHIIFETGGSFDGALCAIYNGKLVIINESGAGLNVEAQIQLDSIANFYGQTGKVGMAFEYVDTNTWRVKLYWNRELLVESPIVDIETFRIGGSDHGGYLHWFGSSTTGIAFTYNTERNDFTPFPYAGLQGDLELYTGRHTPPPDRNLSFQLTSEDGTSQLEFRVDRKSGKLDLSTLDSLTREKQTTPFETAIDLENWHYLELSYRNGQFQLKIDSESGEIFRYQPSNALTKLATPVEYFGLHGGGDWYIDGFKIEQVVDPDSIVNHQLKLGTDIIDGINPYVYNGQDSFTVLPQQLFPADFWNLAFKFRLDVDINSDALLLALKRDLDLGLRILDSNRKIEFKTSQMIDQYPLTGNLESYWNFNDVNDLESTNDLVLNDSILAGGGEIGGGFYLDNTHPSGYATGGSSWDTIIGTKDFSVSYWVYLNSVRADSFSFSDPTLEDGYYVIGRFLTDGSVNVVSTDHQVYVDYFDTDTSSKYISNIFRSRSSGTGWNWNTAENRLESDTSNNDMGLRLDPIEITVTTINDINIEVHYLGTNDDDFSGVMLYDEINGKIWFAGITNDYLSNGIYYGTSFTSDTYTKVANSNNYDVTTAHIFNLIYENGKLEFYVDGQLNAVHEENIIPKTFGIVSLGQDPASKWDKLIATINKRTGDNGYHGNPVTVAPAGTIKADKWIHIVFTRSGSFINYYIDGVNYFSDAHSSLENTVFNTVVMGKLRLYDNFGNTDGFIAEAGIYVDKVLSLTEVQTLYTKGIGTGNTIKDIEILNDAEWIADANFDQSEIETGKWRVHQFTSLGSHTFEIADSSGDVEVEVLIVGGGGTGGTRRGGGGGAGGVVRRKLKLTEGQYTIEVGAGGPRTADPTGQEGAEAPNGENSSAFGLTAFGGGGGANEWVDTNTHTGKQGGSGGGGSGGSSRQSGGAGIGRQGQSGGLGHVGAGSGDGDYGGGGGGFTTAGENATNIRPGNGGYGFDAFEFGLGRIAGGGGGSFNNNNDRLEPGIGVDGGGRGAYGADDTSTPNPILPASDGAQDGQSNTGGGGGGASSNENIIGGLAGGAGGSGVVAIRYRIPDRKQLEIETTSSSYHVLDLETNRWYNLAMGYQNGTLDINIDNQLVFTRQLTFTNSDIANIVGADINANFEISKYFKGEVSALSFYSNRELQAKIVSTSKSKSDSNLTNMSYLLSNERLRARALMAHGLEKLNPNWTDPICRIRRLSDGGEADFYIKSDGGLARLNGVSLDNWLQDSTGRVTKLYDQTGHGHHISATGSQQPLLVKDKPKAHRYRLDKLQLKVTGGDETYNITDTSGVDWRVHEFRTTGSSSLEVHGLERLEVEYLVVAGGGAGARGGFGSGGGGAGGLIEGETTLQMGSIPVTVGAGAIAPTGMDDAPRGEDSKLDEITAIGGGGARYRYDTGTDINGGSGAGGTGDANDRSGGTALQPTANWVGSGNNGGTGFRSSDDRTGGGGGGAGAVGQNASTMNAGDGGIGVESTITGQSRWYAGGGGGGQYEGTMSEGAGGRGGGGKGSSYGTIKAEDGSANTGGGGGGGGRDLSDGTVGDGGDGGSGIVIVRYRTNQLLLDAELERPRYALSPAEADTEPIDRSAYITGGDRQLEVASTGEIPWSVHIFETVGTSTLEIGADAGQVEVEYLIVAGGGGGGGSHGGGGGGAGGLVYGTTTLNAETVTVKVGAGGAGGANDQQGTNGNDSTFNGVTAIGGGGGGGSNSTGTARASGANGGSGGGRRYNDADATAGSALQTGTGNFGNDGGEPIPVAEYAGGGGGAGTAGTSSGGDGLEYDLIGENQWYAGGGGGVILNGAGEISLGGRGGGGSGGSDGGSDGQNAIAGTGGGGGGAGFDGTGNPYAGGNGGSGIVIIRYRKYPLTASQGLVGLTLDSSESNLIKDTDGQITGGDQILNVADYLTGNPWRVHVFSTVGSSNMVISRDAGQIELEYLIVAGGGGGGGSRGGGAGGAGGLVQGKLLLNDQTISIVVGAGGAGGSATEVGTNGANSTFNGITALGGGGGGAGSFGDTAGATGQDGGSGGGRRINNSTATAGTGSQPSSTWGGFGNDGGAPTPTGEYAGGGGGAGTSASLDTGTGGDGLLYNWTGQSKWYAGGGGGVLFITHASEKSRSGLGGGGGGGLGITDNYSFIGSNGENGLSGTGGGGGGAGFDGENNPYSGGNGGSGIVIVRYRRYQNQLSNMSGLTYLTSLKMPSLRNQSGHPFNISRPALDVRNDLTDYWIADQSLSANLHSYWSFKDLNDLESTHTLTANDGASLQTGAVIGGGYFGRTIQSEISLRGFRNSSPTWDTVGTQDLSYSVWFRTSNPTILSSDSECMIMGWFGVNGRIAVTVADTTNSGTGNLRLRLRENNTEKNITIPNVTIAADTWYHVVVQRYNSTMYQIYLDTQLVFDQEENYQLISIKDPLWIGSVTNATTTVVTTDLTEASIWIGRTLTNSEVNILYNKGKAITHPIDTIFTTNQSQSFVAQPDTTELIFHPTNGLVKGGGRMEITNHGWHLASSLTSIGSQSFSLNVWFKSQSLNTARATGLFKSGCHNMGAIVNGKAYIWGINSDGQLGINNLTNQTRPVQIENGQIPTGEKIIKVSNGRYNTIVLTERGKIYTIGSSDWGQLANGQINRTQMTPVRIMETNLPADYKSVDIDYSTNNDPEQPLKDRLESYWDFENLEDSVGENTLSLESGAVLASGESIGSGFYLDLSATNAYATPGTGWTSTIGTGDFSVSFWVYLNTMNSNSDVFSFSDTASDDFYVVFNITPSGRIQNGREAGNGTEIAPNGTIQTNQWYHIAFTRSGSFFNYYINGVKLFSDNANAVMAQTVFDTLLLGKLRLFDNSGAINGKLAELGIYVGKILSQVEVQALYNRGKGLAFPLDTSLVMTTGGGAIVLDNGKVYTFGSATDGKLGNGATTGNVIVPTEISQGELPADYKAIRVFCSDRHTIVLLDTGKLYSFGDATNGRLGNGVSTGTFSTPVLISNGQLPADYKAVEISGGEAHNIIRLENGKLYTWGSNSNGQLGNGDGTLTDTNTPVAISQGQLPADYKATKVRAGRRHSVILADNGIVYTFGDGNDGQLGDGNTTSHNSTTPIEILTGAMPLDWYAVDVSAGLQSTFVQLDSGKIYSCGLAEAGALGEGTADSSANGLLLEVSNGEIDTTLSTSIPMSSSLKELASLSDTDAFTNAIRIYYDPIVARLVLHGTHTDLDRLTSRQEISLTAEWHQLVVTHDSTLNQIRIYLDGQLEIDNLISSNLSLGNQLKLGAYADQAGSFVGSIAEVALWTGRALTSSEVIGLWNKGRGFGYPLPTQIRLDNRLVSTTNEFQAGDREYELDGYKIHIFETTGTVNFELEQSINNAEVLVVAGGGGGGSRYGAGGAGGLIYNSDIDLEAGQYNVQVGTGGVAGVEGGTDGGRGGDGGGSSLIQTSGGNLSLEAIGGGGGGSENSDGRDGGSGGGAGGGSNIGQRKGGKGVAGQGNDGGDRPGNQGEGRATGGGGGGASQVGVHGQTSDPGEGGNGKLIKITGKPVWYAAGGGGGSANVSSLRFHGARGGKNGAGRGSNVGENDGQSGIDGTGGGGGGGGWYDYVYSNGGIGGSGIVIIRYKLNNKIDEGLGQDRSQFRDRNQGGISFRQNDYSVYAVRGGSSGGVLLDDFDSNSNLTRDWQTVSLGGTLSATIVQSELELTMDTAGSVAYLDRKSETINWYIESVVTPLSTVADVETGFYANYQEIENQKSYLRLVLLRPDTGQLTIRLEEVVDDTVVNNLSSSQISISHDESYLTQVWKYFEFVFIRIRESNSDSEIANLHWQLTNVHNQSGQLGLNMTGATGAQATFEYWKAKQLTAEDLNQIFDSTSGSVPSLNQLLRIDNWSLNSDSADFKIDAQNRTMELVANNLTESASATFKNLNLVNGDIIAKVSATGIRPFNVTDDADQTTDLNGYTVKAWTTTGSHYLNTTGDMVADILLIGGGGGGGSNNGAGGGAGGLVFVPNYQFSKGIHNINIGVGGGVVNAGAGFDGANSTLDQLIALGGGGGGGDTVSNGHHGGSGGGALISGNGSGGIGIQSWQTLDIQSKYQYGNAGADDTTVGNRAGGGGAGSAGLEVLSGEIGGGKGLASLTLDSREYNFAQMFGLTYGDTSSGDGQTWFAGGGAAEGTLADFGGGGEGAQAGQANTGGGGAGGATDSSTAGGSGILLIRYRQEPRVGFQIHANDRLNGNLFEFESQTGQGRLNRLIGGDSYRQHQGTAITEVATSYNDSIEAYWRFLGNGRDETANGRNMLILADEYVDGYFQMEGGKFDGHLTSLASGYAQADWTVGIGTGDFTMACWVKINTKIDWSRIMCLGDESTRYIRFQLDAATNQGLRFQWRNDNTGGASGSTVVYSSVPTGEWIHLVATRQGQTGQVYVNGQPVTQIDDVNYALILPSAKIFLLGGDSSTHKADADYSETAVWSRQLSTYEVENLYSNGAGFNKALERFQTDFNLRMRTFRNYLETKVWPIGSTEPVEFQNVLDWQTPFNFNSRLQTNLIGYWSFQKITETGTRVPSGINQVNQTRNIIELISDPTEGSFQTQKQANEPAIITEGILRSPDEHIAEVKGDWSQLIGASDFTLAFWVKAVSISTDIDWVLNWNDLTNINDRLGVRIRGDQNSQFQLNFIDATQDVIDLNSDEAVQAGIWYHLVVTRQGTTGKVYINGLLTDTISNSNYGVSIPQTLYIGGFRTKAEASDNETKYYSDCEIAGLGVWNRILDTSEVEQLYNSGKGWAYYDSNNNYSHNGGQIGPYVSGNAVMEVSDLVIVPNPVDHSDLENTVTSIYTDGQLVADSTSNFKPFESDILPTYLSAVSSDTRQNDRYLVYNQVVFDSNLSQSEFDDLNRLLT